MPKVTKIEVQKKNKERFNLYLDETFEMGIDMDTLVHFNLKKGDVLTPADMAEVQKYEHFRFGLHLAIQYLSYRKRTEKEVVQHLQKHEISETAIAEVIEYCNREGYIDHADYAESLKNTMIRTTDKGPEIYRQKLLKAGIEKDLAEHYTAKYEEEQPLEEIVTLADKLMNQKKGPLKKRSEKVKQSLLQKGYSFEVINEAMQNLDFEPDPEEVDMLLQRELEKVYRKYERKYEGKQLEMKTIEALIRKGYEYDTIKDKLTESGIGDE
ncbi:recombination regulator RecX [Staphylococcus debuckii]|uniref:Regulatory protein RecX n=1 Tax=Staphylococcus debuckii TaxID=2044912 RepID=A0ABU9EZJ6_9STAP|nr:recombination regulator RecX [Staphylococcus debuckii]AYU55594.1 recombination regulator RecX [Staphylococcus debuckii]